MDRVGRFPESSDDFVVVSMSDQNNRVVLPGVADHFNVNLGHQGTSRIDDAQLARARVFPDMRRHSMRAENRDRAVRDLVQTLHEHGAPGRQAVHHKSVVDDLFPHIHGASQPFQGDINDVDRADNPCAKPAGLR